MKKRKNKRKIISRTRKIVILNIVLVCFFMLGIGYSVLQTTLGIDGLLSLFGWGSPFEIEIIETSTPPSGGYNVGDTVYYTVKVKNKSDKVITDVTLVTPTTRETMMPVTETHGVGTLNPGETKEFSCSYIIQVCILFEQFIPIETNVEGTNHNGRTVKGRKVLSINDIVDESRNLNVNNLVLTIVPNNPNRIYKLGEEVVFDITATNLSINSRTIRIEPPEGMTIARELFEGISPYTTFSTTLKYYIKEEDILAGSKYIPISMTVEVGSTSVLFTGEITFDQIEAPYAHLDNRIISTNNPQPDVFKIGNLVKYQITVKNDGNITIYNVTVLDELTGDTWNINRLLPGDENVFTSEDRVSEENILDGYKSNTAIITGTTLDPDNPNIYEEIVAEDSVEEPNAHVSISMNITNEKEVYHLDDIIEYSIPLHNDGNVTINNAIYEIDGQSQQPFSLWPFNYYGSGTYRHTVNSIDVERGYYKVVVSLTATTPDPAHPTISEYKEFVLTIE